MQIGCSESGLSAVPIDLYTVIIYTTYLVLFQWQCGASVSEQMHWWY